MPDERSLYASKRIAFGDRVRGLRVARGWTQEALAERLEVDRKTVNRLENGTYSLTLDRVFQLADILQIEPADLFHGV